MRTVGITGTGSLIGQAVIKSIIRSSFAAEFRLIGFDYFKDTVGSYWCDKNFLLPDLLKKDMEEQWLSELMAIITNEKIELLFIGVDFELPVLARHKKTIEERTGCRIMVSPEEVIAIGNDKYRTYEFLKSNGLSHPLTWLPSDADLSQLPYPVIVKPRVGARSRGVSVVRSEAGMAQALQLAHDPIIQEHVGSMQTEYTCGVIAFNGRVEQSIALRRNLKEGNTYISEYRKDFSAAIGTYINEITEKLKPFGSCNYQLRLDDNGVPKLFEINPRHSGTTYMRSLFGYNEVTYILKKMLDNQVIDFKLTEGKAMRFYEEALIHS